MTKDNTTAAVPAASPEAPATAPVTPKFTVAQHLLASDGPTKLSLPESSRMLDVHMIDGRYYVRTVEPVDRDEDVRQFEIVPAALGSVLSLGDMSPLVVRSGGIHFFVAE